MTAEQKFLYGCHGKHVTPHILSRPYTIKHNVPPTSQVYSSGVLRSTIPESDLQCYHAHIKFYKTNKLLQELKECRVRTHHGYLIGLLFSIAT